MNRSNLDEQQNQSGPQHERQVERGRGPRQRYAGGGERRKLEIARLREVGRNLGAQINEQVEKRPYVVIGAAAGIGFVAGSLLGSRLGQVLLAAGVGYALKNVLGGELRVEQIQAGLEKLAGEGP